MTNDQCLPQQRNCRGTYNFGVIIIIPSVKYPVVSTYGNGAAIISAVPIFGWRCNAEYKLAIPVIYLYTLKTCNTVYGNVKMIIYTIIIGGKNIWRCYGVGKRGVYNCIYRRHICAPV